MIRDVTWSTVAVRHCLTIPENKDCSNLHLLTDNGSREIVMQVNQQLHNNLDKGPEPETVCYSKRLSISDIHYWIVMQVPYH